MSKLKRNIKETFAKIIGHKRTNQNKRLKQKAEIKVQNNCTFDVTSIYVKNFEHYFSNIT